MKLIDKLKLYIKTSIDTIIIDQIENIILALFTSFLANTTIDFFLNEKEMSFALRLIIIVSMAIVSYIIMFFFANTTA